MILVGGFIIWVYMTLWYGLSVLKKRNDIADVAWGLGFVLVSVFNLISNPILKSKITLLLILFWGTRLAWHIYQRNKDKKEDYRYQNWKKSAYLKVFLTQGFFMWLICFPILVSIDNVEWFNLIGILVWVLGFYFEALSDWQLKKFLDNPQNKGKIMQSGLWAYSRHPNYFGEVTMWWGIWLLNLSFVQNWWTIIGPLTITFLILKVSGIPLLEKRYEGNPEFEEYKKKVSPFIPWPSNRKY